MNPIPLTHEDTMFTLYFYDKSRFTEPRLKDLSSVRGVAVFSFHGEYSVLTLVNPLDADDARELVENFGLKNLYIDGYEIETLDELVGERLFMIKSPYAICFGMTA